MIVVVTSNRRAPYSTPHKSWDNATVGAWEKTSSAIVYATNTAAEPKDLNVTWKLAKMKRTEPSAANESHLCGICMKSFARRDLRDRHKRRCAQALKRPRMSKQKSCLSCARSKLRCNQGTPSCERCLDRGMPCEYTTNPTYPVHTSAEYQSSDHSGYLYSSSGAESLSPYGITTTNEPYGASPSGSASTSSRYDDDQSQWDQAVDNFSAFSIADVGPVTNYPSSFPSYSVGGYGFSAAEQLYNDPVFASAPEPVNSYTPFTNDAQPYNTSFRHYGGELYQPQLQEPLNASLGYNGTGLGYEHEAPRPSERSGASSYRTIGVSRSSDYSMTAQDYGYRGQSSSSSTPGSNRPANYRRR